MAARRQGILSTFQAGMKGKDNDVKGKERERERKRCIS